MEKESLSLNNMYMREILLMENDMGLDSNIIIKLESDSQAIFIRVSFKRDLKVTLISINSIGESHLNQKVEKRVKKWGQL